jgi:ATP-dependent DNA helicase RecG
MSLSSLLRRGVGAHLEVMPEPTSDQLAETLVAFANGEGGTVVLGATADGTVTGSLQLEDADSLLHAALAAARPTVRTDWEQLDEKGGLVVAIHVPRSTDMHFLLDGRVLIRTSEGNQPLEGPRISHLAASKASSDYEIEVVPGATRADFDEDVLGDYVKHRIDKQGRDLNLSEDELLRSIGALTADGQPTVAGILLFGKQPQSYLPQSGLTYVRFPGTEVRGSNSPLIYSRREDVNGPLARIVEKAWSILLQELHAESVVHDLQREDRLIYPTFPVREALVNAVCHRDYRTTGRRVEIKQFNDRLEITSPGGLPGYITLENIVAEHFSRNPRLVNGLYQWGYIEELGIGVDTRFYEMARASYPPPDFKETPYTSFTVTLRRPANLAYRGTPKNWESAPNERQARAMQYLSEHGRITNREYHDLCPNVTPETLRLDLNDMIDKGLIMKVGDKKGTYYILK